MKVTSRNDSPVVLYIITKATWGGAQRYVWDLMQAAESGGFAPILLYGERGTLSDRVVAKGYNAYQIPTLARNISLPDDVDAFRKIYRICATLRPRVVHVNSSKAGALGALAARLAGVSRIIFTAHAWAFTESRSRISKCFVYASHYVTVLLSTKTILVSNALAEHTPKWPFVQEKIFVIQHGVQPSDLFSRDDARKEFLSRDATLQEDSLWIGTVAELHHNKGLDVGMQAMQHPSPLPAEWLVIGTGEKKDELAAAGEDLSHIHFLGFIPEAQMYMKAFDIFFLPSRTEALGYVLLEAGMASLPVVATNVGGIPEIIEDGETGLLVPKEDAESTNAALLRLIDDAALRSTLGKSLNKRVSEHFSQKEMLAKTLALYSAD